jgi:hypothetical protein
MSKLAPLSGHGSEQGSRKSGPPRYLSSVQGAERKQQPRCRGGGEEAIEPVQNSTVARQKVAEILDALAALDP